MIYDKKDFIKTFLSDKIEDMSFAQINLDISDMSISDILRNINSTYPINSRCRNQITSGQFAVAILCRSEYLYPYKGLLIIIANADKAIEIYSRDYIVMTVSDNDIKTDESIVNIINVLTSYLITNFKDDIDDFEKFYLKYVYDPEEDEDWEEDYYGEGESDY